MRRLFFSKIDRAIELQVHILLVHLKKLQELPKYGCTYHLVLLPATY